MYRTSPPLFRCFQGLMIASPRPGVVKEAERSMSSPQRPCPAPRPWCSFNWSVLEMGSGRTPSVHTSRWRVEQQQTAIPKRSFEAALGRPSRGPLAHQGRKVTVGGAGGTTAAGRKSFDSWWKQSFWPRVLSPDSGRRIASRPALTGVPSTNVSAEKLPLRSTTSSCRVPSPS